MPGKKNDHSKKVRKKTTKKLLSKGTSDSEVPIKLLLQHLHCPISIFDFRKKKFLYANKYFTELTGLSQEQCSNMDLEDFLKHVESHDLLSLQDAMRGTLIDACNKYVKGKNTQLTYSMNCRFKREDGNFNDIMVQCSVIEWDERKYPAVTLNLYTDLTHHKRDLKVVFTVSVFSEDEKQWRKVVAKEFLRAPAMLSERETEVMKLIARDHQAEAIAKALDMKFYTVRAHWRNILSKTGCKSQKELKEKALHEGWI